MSYIRFHFFPIPFFKFSVSHVTYCIRDCVSTILFQEGRMTEKYLIFSLAGVYLNTSLSLVLWSKWIYCVKQIWEKKILSDSQEASAEGRWLCCCLPCLYSYLKYFPVVFRNIVYFMVKYVLLKKKFFFLKRSIDQLVSTLDLGETQLGWYSRNGGLSGQNIISLLVFFFISPVYFLAFAVVESCPES